MKKVKFGLLIVSFGIVSTMSGHNPNQIGYDLNERDRSLTVHFTLRSAVDLVKKICPETSNVSSILLSDYYQDIEGYFNAKTAIKINQKDTTLFLKEAVLDRHDAFLKFDMNADENWESVGMTVDCYTKIYKRAKNIVNVESRQFKRQFSLDSQHRTFRIGM